MWQPLVDTLPFPVEAQTGIAPALACAHDQGSGGVARVDGLLEAASRTQHA
jgi:hypothetical protein